MSRLAGRSAIVTGGAGGIGRAIAERFLEEGASVMITDLAEENASIVSELGSNAAYRHLDVTQGDEWAAAISEIRSRFGALNILVNNAATSQSRSIEDASEADWRFIMDTNALSVFLGSQHAVREMRTRGGSIINISSARGQRTGSEQCVYSASKAAVLSLTESVALHCGEQGLPVRCNAICPGVIETPMLRRYAAEQSPVDAETMLAGLAAKGIMGRLGQPREIGDAAVFLASDESSYVTGSTINVDGGFRIRDL